jgi:hypothetical protein
VAHGKNRAPDDVLGVLDKRYDENHEDCDVDEQRGVADGFESSFQGPKRVIVFLIVALAGFLRECDRAGLSSTCDDVPNVRNVHEGQLECSNDGSDDL